ncbi:uroporphyrinogen-III synthase [Balneolaceae bacterium YR4-1]|uniref:Uroporphyrinogen-III synthase n=1 Tax=Halalkalibaculum roseum TaxID=2709311 RepID=A0A6M1STE9_9BACT|nr:uroporphyrinogen-III synthase [Halalkalibaculum roseum]NGP75388.1 uroporphyrinogen-III synthase [Halalkalibaculum roseum]
MRQDKRNILVTRPLSGRQLEYARILGLEPIIDSALDFEFPDYWDEVLKVINEHPKSDWIFTSANGVKALKELIKNGLQVRPEVQIFAVGSKTKEALEALGLEAKIPGTQDGSHLADLIIEEGKINSIIYFHGNLSRGEVTEKLQNQNIEVIEVEVYQTKIKPVSLPENPVEAVLFYSPSAVEGFGKGQGFDGDLPALFAIGPTTAEALQKETDQGVEIPDSPDTKELLKTVADHLFNKENIKN